MKKSGYTIIEVIVVINIILILLGVGLSFYNVETNIYRNIENDGCAYEIMNLFTYGKSLCKNENISGTIVIDRDNNEMYFINNKNKIQKSIKISKRLNLCSSVTIFSINPNGVLVNAGTIEIIDSKKNIKNITIGVGVDKITVKN